MKLISFRVKHFKSITDSNECILASDVTVLAGKNEAGKTNILQALDKFNQDKKFDKTDFPLEGSGEPEISLKFKLTEQELEEWIKKFNLPGNINKVKVVEIPIIIKKKADNSYIFESPSGSFTDLLNCGQDELKQAADNKNEAITIFREKVVTNNVSIPVLTTDVEVNSTLIAEISTQFETAFPTLTPEIQAETKEALENVKSKVTIYEKLSTTQTSNKQSFQNSLPKIVFFDSFDQEELLPYEPTFEEAQKNKAVKNYCLIAGLDLKEVIDTKDTQLRRKLVGDKATVIQGDFGEYWRQDKIDLYVASSGEGLIFGIKEKDKTYEFKTQQRSKGLQWFLSFYLLLKAEANGNQNIILVDEPGLYVHAKAQNDILRVLTDLSKNNQIMFSTHSPYLIDSSRLDRIRLVIKNMAKKIDKKEIVETGSKIYELSTIQTADKDTLTPIITAIGLDISKQLSFASDHNVILEGISDYNYLRGFIESLPKTRKANCDELHLIPCKGADNIPTIVSLLLGWGLKFKVILDNDNKGAEVKKILEEKFLIDSKQVLFICTTNKHCIEDAFTKEDFNVYVLGKPKEYETGKLNSEVVPDSQKAVLSRNFLNAVRSNKVKLSKETKDNFNKIFNEIEK